jgi:hypothetical protein
MRTVQEARGGVREAWADYLSHLFKAVEIPYSYKNKSSQIALLTVEGKFTYHTHLIDSHDVLRIRLKFEGKVITREDGRELTPDLVAFSMNDWLSKNNLSKCLIKHPELSPVFSNPRYGVGLSFSIQAVNKHGEDEVYADVIFLFMSALYKNNIYPPNIDENARHFLGQLSSLSEVRGGAAEAWVEYAHKHLQGYELNFGGTVVRISSLYSRDLTAVELPDTVKLVYVSAKSTNSGTPRFEPEVTLTFRLQGEFTPANKAIRWGDIAGKLLSVHTRGLIFRIPTVNIICEAADTGGAYREYHIGDDWYLDYVIPIGRMVNSNKYPSGMHEAAVQILLQEARGGATVAWTTYLQNKLRGWSFDIHEGSSYKGTFTVPPENISCHESGKSTGFIDIFLHWEGEMTSQGQADIETGDFRKAVDDLQEHPAMKMVDKYAKKYYLQHRSWRTSPEYERFDINLPRTYLVYRYFEKVLANNEYPPE